MALDRFEEGDIQNENEVVDGSIYCKKVLK